MKKKKLITSLAISAGLITTATISTIAITSCSVDNDYNPDTSTKIMEVIPNKETFNKMKAALERIVRFQNEKEDIKGKFKASIRVDKNVFYIDEWFDSLHGVTKFVFNDTNNVQRFVIENDIVNEKDSGTITLEQAKQEILDFFTNEFN